MSPTSAPVFSCCALAPSCATNGTSTAFQTGSRKPLPMSTTCRPAVRAAAMFACSCASCPPVAPSSIRLLWTNLAAVLEQAEAVGEQELQFGARRQPGAELQRGIVREHGIDRPPQAGVGEVHVGAVQRDRAGGPDIAVQRVIDARQVGGIGARQDGLVGLRQRVEDVGALVAADRAQVGQLQRVFAQLRADRALPEVRSVMPCPPSHSGSDPPAARLRTGCRYRRPFR